MNSLTPEVRLQSRRLNIRTMRRDDLDAVDAWRPFTDPLYALWNIPQSTSLSRDIWFTMHGSDSSRMWFVIEREADGQVVGTLSLREIVEHVSARLGITLGADYVDQGYGTEALRTFLTYYFEKLGFQRMLLDVAAANARAIHVYRRLGFQQLGSHYRNIPKETDLSFLQKEAYRPLRPFFRRHFGQMQLLFYDMVLERRDWLTSRQTV